MSMQDLFHDQAVYIMLVTISHPEMGEPIRITNFLDTIVSREHSFISLPFDIKYLDDQPDAAAEFTASMHSFPWAINALNALSSAADVLLEIVRDDARDTVFTSFNGLKLTYAVDDHTQLRATMKYVSAAEAADTAARHSAQPFPVQHHGVIYCDPPWQYEMYSDAGLGKSPDQHYSTMSLQQLKALRDEVFFATGPDAACIMWATFALFPQALELMKEWGFTYKTGGPWIKRAGTGNPAMGTGYVLRSSAECFLIGTRGAPKVRNRGQRNVLLTGEWPARVEDLDSVIVDTLRREHSRKPDEMIPLIEALFDGPYLELFARTTRPGWTVWGNQTDKF